MFTHLKLRNKCEKVVQCLVSDSLLAHTLYCAQGSFFLCLKKCPLWFNSSFPQHPAPQRHRSLRQRARWHPVNDVLYKECQPWTHGVSNMLYLIQTDWASLDLLVKVAPFYNVDDNLLKLSIKPLKTVPAAAPCPPASSDSSEETLEQEKELHVCVEQRQLVVMSQWNTLETQEELLFPLICSLPVCPADSYGGYENQLFKGNPLVFSSAHVSLLSVVFTDK